MLKKFLRQLIRNRAGTGVEERARTKEALRNSEAADACLVSGHLGEAEKQYRSAIQNDPYAAALRYNLGLLLHNVGDLAGAEESYRQALALGPDDQAIHSSFLCIGDFSTELSRDEIFLRHCSWAETFADPLTRSAKPHCNAPDPGRRLRIGYVSADLRDHVIARFIEPVLGRHDSKRFEVYCYSASAIQDGHTQRLKSLVPNWRSIHAMDDEQAATLIRDDVIDLLVDLSGHSAGNRLLVFARKPAPLQLTWMGYLNTTGMSSMDYRVTDAMADPAGSDHWYREKLLRLSRPQWCYEPRCDLPDRPIRRHTEGARGITFGCMTRFMKISDKCIELWVDLLRSVPNTRLRIIDTPDHPRAGVMRKRFIESGLSDRIEFQPTQRGDSYWHSFHDIDIALDPFPYTGGTTTFDCLWMGVPVITLAGVCGAARSGASVLAGAGLSDLVARTPQEFISIARGLTGDVSRLSALQAGMRVRMRGFPFCDAGAFTSEFEDLLCSTWSEWCVQVSNAGVAVWDNNEVGAHPSR